MYELANYQGYFSRYTGQRRKIAFVVALAGMLAAALLPLLSSRPTNSVPAGKASAEIAGLPLSFEPNAGQTDPSVRFMAHASGGTLFFTPSRVVLALAGTRDQGLGTKSGTAKHSTNPQSQIPKPLSIEFVGANPSTEIQNGEALPGKVNYLRGNDPSAWHRNLPTYAGIGYHDLYAGIDLNYSGTGGDLKGTYTVAAGADPSQIRWRYDGAKGTTKAQSVATTLDTAGNLQIELNSALNTPHSTLTEHAPLAWQEIDGKRVAVSVSYRLNADGTIGFELGAYDHAKPLTIDPTITYSTYLGGFYGDGAASIELDSGGNIYVGGTTSSSDFPMAGNPYQPIYGGGDYDMFASKISPNGSSLIYSTFVGGGDWDVGGLAGVDAAGIATLGGWTTSDDFPTTPGAYQTEYAGTGDVAVAKLSADGSDLIFGSYWGDAGVDESDGFAVDSAGNTYFTGYWIPGFSFWAFVAALSPDGSQQLFRRNLGGSVPGPGDENANTSGFGVAVDGSGNIYVTGYTRAADFPTTPGAYRTSIEAFEDGFMTKLSPMAQSIIYSTYIPGGVSDYPYDIAIDQSGNAYITGNTSSSDYPTTPGVFQSSCGDPRCAFITKLNPAGSALVYSSFLGGPDFYFETEDYGFVVRVNQAGNAYVGGYTSAPDFPVVNSIQATLHGPYDGFLTKFNLAGTGVEYSTYLGGSAGDSIEGITLDGLGHVYIAGSSSSTDFPVVNPLQPTNHGGGDAIIAVISEEGAVTATPTPTRTGTPPTATATPNPCGGVTPWRTETPMPIAHSNSAAAVLNNQLYVIGGASNSPTPVRYTQKFDPSSNSWSNRAAYPNGLGLAYQQAVAVDGKIYTVGDTYQPSQSFIEMYDPVTDNWSRKATLPEPLQIGALAAYSGKVYIIGGQVPGQYPSSHVYEYDPVTDTFTSKAPMPTGQAEIGAAVIGNRIYAVGGWQYIHYVYDPAANSWSTIATPPTPTFSFPAVFAFNGELWVIGGYDNWTRRGYPPGQEVQIYNPLTNSWRYGPILNQPRYYSTAAGVINGRAYLVGGIDLNSNNYPYDYLNSMESITYLPCTTATPGTPTAIVTPPTITPTRTGTVVIASPTGTGVSQPSSTPTGGVPASATATAHGQPSSTATAHATTLIPTATPTTCTVTFSDVPSDSPFYPYVRCLACRGILSGYNDGTFRPGNDVTRGQLSKIVSNSAGFQEVIPDSRQTFTDVPSSNPFYLWIERMVAHDVITGYQCGGPNEPCDAQNRPYFRWGANATRGQISKIVSEAKGFGDEVPPSQQTFTDVPSSNTFWLWIERLAERGVMSGYQCGGTNEPCDPQNRGYFRWYNNATRGQTAKIVSNTFFPGCSVANKP
jgi:N-acetylneuraminic acid mutarotase